MVSNQEQFYSVRDIAAMQNGEVSAGVIEALAPGEVFAVAGKSYQFVKRSKPTLQKEGDHSKSRVTVKDLSSGKNITGYLMNFSGRSSYYGNEAWNNLGRDIEGDIMADLINEFNPFHEFSDSYRLAKKYLNNINNKAEQGQCQLF